MSIKSMKLMVLFLIVTVGVVFLSATAQADIKQIKAYKEAFPEAKLKCIDCHVTALPKKEDGQHENNDYGKAVLVEAQKEAAKVEAAKEEAAEEEVKPTADTYKTVGKIEEFKK